MEENIELFKDLVNWLFFFLNQEGEKSQRIVILQENAIKSKEDDRDYSHNTHTINRLNKVYSSNLIGYSQHTAAGVIRPPHVYNWKSLPEIM